LKPIQSGAEAIEAGGFGHLIPVGSDDEIGSLTQYINRMSQKLQTFFRELEEKNKQLTEQFAIISRSQREWQETFDNISNPIAVIDHQYALIRANKTFRETFEECFSRDRGEAIRTWNEYFGPPFFQGTGPSSQKGRAPSTWEIHQQKTGKIFEASLFPYFSPGGGTIGSVVILKDITQKKEGEMELIMTERLAALGQMASGIAHELNTPLATIAACNEGLLNRVEKENIGSLLFRSYLKIIEEEIQRCKKITTGMLSFVRRPDHDRREVDVNEVLDKTIDMVTFQGRLKEVELVKNVERTMPKVLGNEGELMQVFLSIMINALDAMEDKGTLTLETGSDGSTIFAKIGDSGPGIPPDLMNRIFDPFYTTKAERGGTGLGLSIADKIIRTHNGKIEVTSEKGRGTTFKIILPV
jgi:nitrogen-specific signal transduction histidine kinase